MAIFKGAFHNDWQSGRMGVNKPESWNSFDAVLKSGYAGLLSIRHRKSAVDGGGGGKKVKDIDDAKNYTLEEAAEFANKYGYLAFSTAMPDDQLTIQGEIQLHPSGLYMHYSTINDKMRPAMAECSHHAFGLQAKMLLDKHVDASSRSDFRYLFEAYSRSSLESPVIEFSAYSCPVGIIPGRNTVIWEVRNY